MEVTHTLSHATSRLRWGCLHVTLSGLLSLSLPFLQVFEGSMPFDVVYGDGGNERALLPSLKHSGLPSLAMMPFPLRR